jgi:hypothetical protein
MEPLTQAHLEIAIANTVPAKAHQHFCPVRLRKFHKLPIFREGQCNCEVARFCCHCGWQEFFFVGTQCLAPRGKERCPTCDGTRGFPREYAVAGGGPSTWPKRERCTRRFHTKTFSHDFVDFNDLPEGVVPQTMRASSPYRRGL